MNEIEVENSTNRPESEDEEAMYLVISTSLSPDSRSRVLADAASVALEECGADYELLDLREVDLPLCDGGLCYQDEQVQRVTELITRADGVLFCSPIYNFDVNAAAKNLIELTGKAWMEKVVGFLCSAGGQGSYMSVMSLANSLMLDFRSMVLPRFVYATGDAFQGDAITDLELKTRIEGLVEQMVRVATALQA